MRTILQTIWQLFSTPLGRLALLISILLGFLSILEKAWVIAVGAYSRVHGFYLSREDGKVLKYMKETKPNGSTFDIPEIAAALKKRQQKVLIL